MRFERSRIRFMLIWVSSLYFVFCLEHSSVFLRHTKDGFPSQLTIFWSRAIIVKPGKSTRKLNTTNNLPKEGDLHVHDIEQLGPPVPSVVSLPQFLSESDLNSRQSKWRRHSQFCRLCTNLCFPHQDLSQNYICWHTHRERTCTSYEVFRSQPSSANALPPV